MKLLSLFAINKVNFSLIFIMIIGVKSHGMITSPTPRLLSGDASNGYTFARTASNYFCQRLPRQQTQVINNSPLIKFIITAAHRGHCYFYQYPQGTITETNGMLVGRYPNCGTKEGNYQIVLNLTRTSGIIQWKYITDNYSGEIFQNCVDYSITTTLETSTTSTLPRPINLRTSTTSTLPRPTTLGTTRCVDQRVWSQSAHDLNGLYKWVYHTCPMNTRCRDTLGYVICGHVAK